MKANFSLGSVRNGSKQMARGFVLAVAVTFLHHDATASTTVPLGTASGFAVLAGSGITVAGAVNTTTITGDIGTYPTPSITGLGNVVLNGANQTADTGLMLIAKNDLVTAYGNAAGQSATVSYGSANQELGGLNLTPGVYNDSTSFGLTGILTLNAGGDPNAVWIFQAGSTLTTASNSKVDLIGGAQACHVFWQVGSSATLGTYSDFAGNILALTSITADTGATVDGRLLAQNGAVTLDNNTITKSVCNSSASGVPDTGGTLWLLGSGVAALLAFRRRFPSLA